MINILISVNDYYLDKAKTMLFSIYKNTKEQITVYLLNHRLTDDEVKEFTLYMMKKCKITVKEIDVKNTELDNFPIGNVHFTIETYYRILAPFILPKSLDRILWLDADIIVFKDISEFYHQDFNDKKYVVCSDRMCNSDHIKEVKTKVGIPDSHTYFNAGVMLINLDLLRKESDFESIMKQCNLLKDKLIYFDQDLLNYMYANDVKYAETKKYNYQLLGDYTIPDDICDKITILHYSSGIKPWDSQKIKDSSKYYWKYRYKQGYKKECIKIYIHRILDNLREVKNNIKNILFIIK